MPDSSALKGKTILVTGATGFIGSHLFSRLENEVRGRLIGLSRQGPRQMSKPSKFLRSSLADLTPEFWKKHGAKQIDIVFHLGAFTPKKPDDRNKVTSAIEDNVLGTHALLQSFIKSPEKIVFASTLDCYPPTSQETILDEFSPVDPASVYGASKLFCESLIRDYGMQRHVSFAILRYGHIYGPGEESYEKMIPATIKRVLRHEPPIVHGDGSALRDFLFVDDVVEATIRAACSNEAQMGPLNIVSGRSISMLEVVNKIVQLSGSSEKIQFVPEKSASTSLRFNNRLMKAKLGVWPLVSLEEGLKREIESVQERV